MQFRSGLRRLVRWLVLPTLVAALVSQAAPPALADDPQAELEKAQNKLEFIRQQKERTKNLLADAYWQSQEAQVQLRNAEGDLAVANSQLAVLTNQLTLAEADLKKVDVDLAVAQKKLVQNKDRLSKRIRAINEEGRVNYLAVLFGSASFTDFITRFDMLKMVVRKDSELFSLVRKDKLELEDRQNEATARRNRLSDLKAQAELRRSTVAVKRDEKAAATTSLEQSKKRLQAQLTEYDQEEEKIQELVVEIQRKLARKGGKFAPIYPVRKPATITDYFGPRIHPILGGWRQHNGLDLGAREGDPVFAIEDGQVIIAGWNDAFGNLIVIDHGNSISSWYAHSSKLLVRVNDMVTQGQRIANAGTTGWSTGPHVHLEIRVDGKPQNPLTYLNP